MDGLRLRMDEYDREALLQRIDAASAELATLIERARALNLRPTVPLRAPVVEALQTQIQRAQQFLAGQHVERRRPEHQRPGRASDYRP